MQSGSLVTLISTFDRIADNFNACEAHLPAGESESIRSDSRGQTNERSAKNGSNLATPHVEGFASKQAHADIPEKSFERELGREGFMGAATHMYHRNPPTAWLDVEAIRN